VIDGETSASMEPGNPPVRQNCWSDFEFAGWVPCVTGRLSFSAIGSSSIGWPFRVRRFNALGGNVRADHPGPSLVVFQRRPNRDFAWPQRGLGLLRECLPSFSTPRWLPARMSRLSARLSALLDDYFPKHSTFFYLLSARTAACPVRGQAAPDNRGVLHGEIRLIRKGTIVQNMSLARAARAMAALRAEERAAGWMALEDACEGLAADKVSFSLFRTGEVRLKLPEETMHWTPGIGEDPERDPPQQVRLAYYFLKDCAHSHYHHHDHADQILRVRKASIEDDITWRRETLWDIARAIIGMRRERKFFRRRDALGVMAYAEAFQKNLAPINRINRNGGFATTDEVGRYDFEQLKHSIVAENDSAAFRIQGLTSVILACFAMILTLVMMHHSASSILVGKGGISSCVLNPRRTIWVVAGLLVPFALIWDMNFHKSPIADRAWLLAKQFAVSLARIAWLRVLLLVTLGGVFTLAAEGVLDWPEFAATAWSWLNLYCLAY